MGEAEDAAAHIDAFSLSFRLKAATFLVTLAGTLLLGLVGGFSYVNSFYMIHKEVSRFASTSRVQKFIFCSKKVKKQFERNKKNAAKLFVINRRQRRILAKKKS